MSADAADIGVMAALGVRGNSGSTDLPNANVSNKTSFDGGILGVVPIAGQFAFRSGFLATQRYAEVSPTNQGTIDVNFVYVDVPVTLMFLATPTAGIFAGPVIAMNVVKDCSASNAGGSQCTNVKSVAFPLTIGIQARLFGQVGAELYYENTSGNLADHISNYTSVGGNILFYFD
jgi:hypothetical protein